MALVQFRSAALIASPPPPRPPPVRPHIAVESNVFANGFEPLANTGWAESSFSRICLSFLAKHQDIRRELIFVLILN